MAYIGRCLVRYTREWHVIWAIIYDRWQGGITAGPVDEFGNIVEYTHDMLLQVIDHYASIEFYE